VPIFLLAVLIPVSALPFAALRALPKRRLPAKRGGSTFFYGMAVVFGAQHLFLNLKYIT
jgi:hypothetical protein